MLKYLKRQKSRRRSRENDDINNDGIECSSNGNGSGTNINVNVSVNDKRNSLRSTSSFCDEIFFEELSAAEADEDAVSCGASSLRSFASLIGAGGTCLNEDIFKYHSRLSMCLSSIVNAPNCLSYFVQFLETKEGLPLIKFYLDIDNFKTAAKSQILKEENTHKNFVTARTEMDQFTKCKKYCEATKVETNSFEDNKVGREIESNYDGKTNIVPELKTLCDLSMRRPITDDEKSQICAETNKQLTKCTNNNNNNIINSNNNNNYKNIHNLNDNLNNTKWKGTSEISLLSSTSTNTNHDSISAISMSAASLNDAMAIYQKYLNANSTQFVSLPVAIITQISFLLCKRSDKFGSIDAEHMDSHIDSSNSITMNCFDDAQDYVLHELETKYLNDFLQSSFYSKYCVELIENTSNMSNNTTIRHQQHQQQEHLNIFDILHSEVTLFFFMEFLEQHGERQCLDFWTTAINFRKSFASTTTNINEKEAQVDAMLIYEKFFSLQAEQPLWSSDRLRSWVEEHICAPGQVQQSFDLPLQVVGKYLDLKYLNDFVKSQLFENYVNELKAKINAEQPQPQQKEQNIIFNDMQDNVGRQTILPLHKLSLRRARSTPNASTKHRKTLSDCTNENTCDLVKNFPSTQNTLLAAMDPVHKNTTVTTDSGSNIQIDSSQLNNPNLLWQRSYNTEGGLKFGRVNSLGRYERDFDVCHDLSSGTMGKHNWSLGFNGNKIKNAMRKLVNLPEDRVQEEIAWQVAEMIVKDITSVTLQHNNNDDNVPTKAL